jgi:hypothetical protein
MSNRSNNGVRVVAAALAFACAHTMVSAQSSAAVVQTTMPRAFDLPAQALTTTLARIASESGLALSLDSALVRDRVAPAVLGTYAPER